MSEKPVEHTELESLQSLFDSLVKTQNLQNDRIAQLFARLGFESQSLENRRSHDDDQGSSCSESEVQLAGTLPGLAGIVVRRDESPSLLAGDYHGLAPSHLAPLNNEKGLAGTN